MTFVLDQHPPAPPVGEEGRWSTRFRNRALGLVRRRAVWFVAFLAFLVSFAGSWQPSYWGDEAASIMSAQRSFSSLFDMLHNIDAVHGLYYLFLHGWIELFGASEISTRLPSAIAIGAAAAGTVVLARFFMDSRIAIGGALLFAIIPRVTYMGTETRSTAIATALGVWLTVVLVHALRSRHASWRHQLLLWTSYSLLLALGIYVFLFIVLLLPVHAVVVLVAKPERRLRRTAVIWLGASLLGLVVAAPMFLAGILQREQIAFIGRRPTVPVSEAAVTQWFDTVPVAIVAWSLISVAVLAVFVPRLRSDQPPALQSDGYRSRPTLPSAAGLTIFLAWMVVPSAILLIGTQVLTPMYSLRYLSLCAPAVGVAMAVGVAALANNWLRALTVVALVAVIAPVYLVQQSNYGKNEGSDWRQVANVMAVRASPGDGIVFDQSVRPSRVPRLARYVYPDAFVGLRDITLIRSHADTAWLWDEVAPLDAVLPAVANLDRIWLLQYSGSGQSRKETDVRILTSNGFHVAQTTLINRTRIIEMTR